MPSCIRTFILTYCVYGSTTYISCVMSLNAYSSCRMVNGLKCCYRMTGICTIVVFSLTFTSRVSTLDRSADRQTLRSLLAFGAQVDIPVGVD